LLATTATVRTRLYHRALEARGIEVIEPDAGGQEAVMEAIFRVKRGDLAGARGPLVTEARRLEEAGADAVVAGCTEIPLVLGQGDLGVPLIDATEVLAAAAVRAALQE
jgi:aspartate racemase